MTQADPSLRLFVAIELPETWKQSLGEVQQRMQQVLAADAETAAVRLRWVRTEGVHLTLKFIGEVAADRVPVIESQLALAVPAMPAISLQLGRAGAFSDRRSPRVIWAGVYSDEADTLRRLAEGVETWLAAAGVPRERRGFTAHLTLARLPNDLPDELRLRVAELTASVEQPQLPRFAVERVSLMRSQLGPGGARYERIAAFPA
jgi:2'-5' RNA ligase